MATRLTDDEYLGFLNEGYRVIQPESVDDDFHDQLWRSADTLYDRARKLESPTAHLEILGDNLRAVVPELDRLLADPSVTGAVTSILGDGAFLHPHNFVHQSTTADQPFHQDGNLPWNERGHYRSHRPDWLILFYYPQNVTLLNGPTEVVPCSQYWTTDIERDDGTWRPGDPIDPDLDRNILSADDLAERDRVLAASLDRLGIDNLQRRFIEVPRGSVVIGNYDLIHRGTRTQSGQAPRYMYKFYYARTREPTCAAWDNNAQHPSFEHVREDLHPIVESNWAWSLGTRARNPLGDAAINRVIDELCCGGEHKKVTAAYRLGSDTGTRSLDELLQALHDERESTRRAASYGLRLRCDEVGEALARATRHGRVSVRRFATFALGAAWSPGTDALIERLAEEPDDLARSNAAYAIGQVARHPEADAPRLLDALIDRLRPGAEPDNTNVAGLSRSTVRQSTAYAILQAASNHTLPDSVRRELTDLAAAEQDRYVLGMLTEAIASASPDAALIRTLAGRRWSAL